MMLITHFDNVAVKYIEAFHYWYGKLSHEYKQYKLLNGAAPVGTHRSASGHDVSFLIF